MSARFRPAPFAFSLLIHGSILAWVASGPVYEKSKSLYAQAIQPHASKLIWYDFRQKLPDVSPAPIPAPAKAPRAETKIAAQEIVAGAEKAPRAQQFVWQPAPKVALSKDLQSPNVLALHVPRPEPPPKPKLFVPPPEAPQAPQPAPKVDAPPEIHAADRLPAQAPAVKLARVQPRGFVAPSSHPLEKRAPALPVPEAIPLASTVNAPAPSTLGKLPAPAPRDFVPPPATAKPGQSEAPLPDAPALPEAAQPAAVSMAIVGLNPANAPAPAPEGSRNAQFSAGPQPRKTGGMDGSSENALLTVPGLMIRNATPDGKPGLTARVAAPTSAANLRAALHESLPDSIAPGPRPAAMRVSSAPDSFLNGRDTYQMMVQMPNTTSYTGTWMIWFAERQRQPGSSAGLSPPVPVRKVDPKYYPAAIADRVEGKVRLTAVIRADGHVDSVELLMHLDDRLDKSSAEAIGKWEFEPALRNGQPVDVDAVFEIPFRLAPKVPK
ncbi:MAG: TonB family protein [Bryobacteraceae bacterium]|jgi:TonB family protein